MVQSILTNHRLVSNLTYFYPKLANLDLVFFVIGGPGLANMFFPIYRALQASKEYDGEFLMPTPTQIKIGPALRGERDLRLYSDIFVNRSLGEILKRLSLYLRETITEESVEHVSMGLSGAVLFAGLKNYFKDLDVSRRQDFMSLLSQRSSNPLQRDTIEEIALHIRMGDFSQKQTNNMNSRVSLDWYAKALEVARERYADIPARIYSDEPEKCLEFASKIDCGLADAGNALEDIFKLAKSRALVASQSSFSLWASFLGQSETFLPAGFNFERYAHPDQFNVTKVNNGAF